MSTSDNRTENSFPWAAAAVVGSVLVALVVVLITNGGLPERDKPRAQRINCLNNLKQIGLAFRQWAVDHSDQFPFTLSTNAGGTLESCHIGEGGFDNNSAVHIQVLSNELNTPFVLVCPKDHSRKPARDFGSLQASNVTYRLRSSADLNEANSREILVVCPIDGNSLYCDGAVSEAKRSQQ